MFLSSLTHINDIWQKNWEKLILDADVGPESSYISTKEKDHKKYMTIPFYRVSK